MRLFLISLLLLVSARAGAACPPLLDHSLPTLDERSQSLCAYAGKVLLVVNTASKCGYTPQYDGLEALYRKYRARGLVVLGFPSNDFGGQEPGSNKDISTFCINEYAIDFPMFAKSPLGANPFYAGLVKATGAAPAWNFHKYLVDRTGRRVQSFATRVEPNDPKLVATLEQLLAQPPEDRR
jgi:glutathione peroxidase